MARLTWLADVLRTAGLTVIELDGWRTRGADRITVNGIVCHHTASGPTVPDERMAAMLRDGRPDLAGPLSQLGLDRQGRYWLIAAGRCNHNGYGLWGNDAIGIEAFNNGVGEPWPAVQIDAYERGCAAFCTHLNFDPAYKVKAHRETDPTRKNDPVGIDMTAFRAQVRAFMTPPLDLEEYPVEFIAQFPDSSGYLVDTSSGFILPLTADGAADLEKAPNPVKRVRLGDGHGTELKAVLQEIRRGA